VHIESLKYVREKNNCDGELEKLGGTQTVISSAVIKVKSNVSANLNIRGESVRITEGQMMEMTRSDASEFMRAGLVVPCEVTQ
jgi:hypothetical protein